jgi:phosphoglycolate phosphatase
MSILQQPRTSPAVILFDWHATLVDTHDAMYHAIDDVLPRLHELGLFERLLTPSESKTIEDAKLLKYVREHGYLHPKIRRERRISRTDIFELLFGSDSDAKRRAHAAFDDSYKKYVDEVHPLEADASEQLKALHDLGMVLGVISNRRRDYLLHELSLVAEGQWQSLFSLVVSGSDVEHRKPAPDLILYAMAQLRMTPSPSCWYVGDSTTDVIAAGDAGVTSVFYNGVGWSEEWINKIFPNTVRHPHFPDTVVRSLAELVALVRLSQAQRLRVSRARQAED